MNSSDKEAEVRAPEGRPARGLPRWKRTLDLVMLVLLSPGLLLVGGVVALYIKLVSRGDVFFRQKRVGYKGQEFTCYKFRTMEEDADTKLHHEHMQHLIKSDRPMNKLDGNDHRLIPLARFLRAGGLDELPQMYNILRGEMSFIGPRPCIRYECDDYEPWHWKRFDAVPGLSGLWQVSGKNRTTFEQMVKLDIAYSVNMSLWLDLKIIFLTAPALVRQYRDLRARRRSKAVEAVVPEAPLQEPAQSYNS